MLFRRSGLAVDGPHARLWVRVAGLALVAGMFAWRLGAWPLFDPDEGRNAEVGREMLGGDWIVPHFNGLPYLDKPVLFFWLTAGAFRLFGVGEAAARLPAALGAVATVVLTTALGTVLIGRTRALVAGAVAATSPLLLVFGRLAIFDVPLTALVTAALYCLVRARLDGTPGRWWPLAGIAIGLAILTKGPVGAAVPLLAWAAARGALPRADGRAGFTPAALAIAAAALVVGPWVLAAAGREPGFLRYALVDETFLRFVSTERFHRAGPIYFYATVLPWALGAWAVVLAVAAVPLGREWRDGGRDAAAIAFAVRAATAIVLLFTVSASKRAQYVLPAMVPLALLVAIGVAAFPARVAAALAATGRWVALAGVATLIAAFVLPPIDGAEFFVLTPRVFAAAGIFLAGWGAVTAVTGTRRPAAAAACAACFAPGLGLALLGPLTGYAESRSASELARHIDPAARVIAFETFEPGLALYLRRPVLLLSDTGRELTSNYVRAQRERLMPSATLRPVAALSALLSDPAPLYVVTAPARLRKLRRFGGRLTPVYADRRTVLLSMRATRTDGIGRGDGEHRSGAS